MRSGIGSREIGQNRTLDVDDALVRQVVVRGVIGASDGGLGHESRAEDALLR